MKEKFKLGDMVRFRNLAHYPSLSGKLAEIVEIHETNDEWQFDYSIRFFHDDSRMSVKWSEIR